MNGKRLLGAALALFVGLGPVQPGLGAAPAQTVWRGQFEGWLPLPSQTPDPAAAAAAGGLRGRSLVLRDDDLQGPAGLACGRARPTLLKMPAQGLFQGALDPAGALPPAAQARALGLDGARVLTLRIECDNASLDLHRDRAGHWLLALDGRVARWREARAGAGDSPLAAVLALLVHHQSAQHPSVAAQAQALRRWLHPQLQRAFADYLRQPWPPDEVPPLDGDPFTDSQEPTDRLQLGPARIDGGSAQVPVRVVFDLGAGREAARSLRYELQRHQGHWRVLDVRDEQGSTLRELLSQRPPAAAPARAQPGPGGRQNPAATASGR